MKPSFRFWPGLALLAGCSSPRPADPTELAQPLLGSNRETRFYLTTGPGSLDVRDVVAVAKVLRRYKTLDGAEKALVRLAAERNLRGIVALEARKIAAEPRMQAERRRALALPDRAAAARASAELAARIYREATQRVAERLNHLVAVPIKAAENRSIVAFAKVTEGQVQVADNAYELDAARGSMAAGAKARLPNEIADQLAASHGATATVLEEAARLGR